MNALKVLSMGVIFSGACLAWSQSPYVDLGHEPSMVTLIQVLANPEAYDHREIEFVGFLNLSFEADALWLHKEDYDNAILGNSIWVVATPEMIKARSSLQHKYVLIKGMFDAKNHGHLGAHSGTLTNVLMCKIWSDPLHPRGTLPPPPPSSAPRFFKSEKRDSPRPLTLRSTRTPPALPLALSQHLASSAPLVASVQAGPVSFFR